MFVARRGGAVFITTVRRLAVNIWRRRTFSVVIVPKDGSKLYLE
jgi:hypothetical protein